MNGIKRLASFLVVASVAMGMFNAYGDGEVIVSAIDNANRTATVTFAAAEEGQKLVFAYGKSDYGQNLKEWTRNANLAEYALAVGATSLTVTLPEAWGTTAFYGRFLIKGLGPLPVDALLDYVETQRKSDGSAGTYIRTGIYPNQDTCVEMDFELASSLKSNQFQTFFCARESNSGGFTLSLNYLCQGRYDNLSNGSAFTAFLSSTLGTRYVLKNVGNTLTAYKQSDHSVVNSLTGGNAAGTIFNAPEMILFMATSSGNLSGNACSLKFYSFKLRDGEAGPLLADYVPAQKDGVAGVYDYVSDKFIPSANTTYPFVAGSVVEENPQTEAALAWSVPQQGLTGMIGTGGRIFPALDGSGDVVHVFDAAGDFAFIAPAVDIDLRYLIVGGGGAGGATDLSYGGGGGGGGGVVTNDLGHLLAILAGTRIVVKVGAGGQCQSGSYGLNGEESSISAKIGLEELLLVGVGGGGGSRNNTGCSGGNGGGGSGASKSGGSATQTASEGCQMGGTIIGFSGGTSSGTGGAGGGGGAGMSGVSANEYPGGAGGAGAWSDITGEGVYYGGGGGGGCRQAMQNANNAGGNGGGGDGASYVVNTALATPGEDGFGGGGGGGTPKMNSGNGARGGSGVVVLRYMPSTDLPEEPVGKLSGIEIKDVKVKGEATNVVEEVAYKVEWAGNGADFADVSVVYGASPDALTKEKPLAKNVIGSGLARVRLPQSTRGERTHYVALKIVSDAGTFITEPVQVTLPKHIFSGAAVLIR